MRNSIKELTERMQHLCAVANRIVAANGAVGQIETDLLLEDLRRLYDIGLQLQSNPMTTTSNDSEASGAMADQESREQVVVATRAAMAIAEMSESNPVEATSDAEPDEPTEVPQTESMQTEPIAEPEQIVPMAEEKPQSVEFVAASRIELPQVPHMPTMEEIENNGNSLLFDEVIIEDVATPSVEPKLEPMLEANPTLPETEVLQPKIEPEPTPEVVPEETVVERKPIIPEPEPVVLETTSEPEPAIESETVKIEPEVETTKPAEGQPKSGGQSSLFDYLKYPAEEAPSVKTLGETLISGGTLNLSESHMQKKVDDLRTVININDKFSFMSELFHNNMKAYNDFIMHLNGLNSREEALVHVKTVAAQYQWDDNSPAVATFYKIFDKKF